VQGEKEREDHYYGELHNQAKELADRRGVQLNCAIVPGRTVDTITHYARQGNFDLIVIGGARPGLWHAFLGTSSRVSRQASRSVMVVR
jgi:nucleotide-binding universal stress UspA family protein